MRSLASRVPAYAGRLDDAAVDGLMDSPVAAQARHMLTYSAVGDIATVRLKPQRIDFGRLAAEPALQHELVLGRRSVDQDLHLPPDLRLLFSAAISHLGHAQE